MTTEQTTIYDRLHAIMKDVRGVGKTQFNQHGKYKYAGHEQVTEALRDAYVKHKVVRSASVEKYDRTADGTLQLYVVVEWRCSDNPESFCSVGVLGEAPTTTSNGKATGQQAGVALSYAVKLAELKRFSLTGDDTPNPEENDESNDIVSGFIDRFDSAKTVADVEAISGDIKAAGNSVGKGRQALLEARTEAMKRVSAK